MLQLSEISSKDQSSQNFLVCCAFIFKPFMGTRVFISFIASFIKVFFSKLLKGLDFSELSGAFVYFLFRKTRVS